VGRKRLPAPITTHHERIQSRAYDSNYAELPDGEWHRKIAAGAGPWGTVTSAGISPAAVTVAVGAAFALLVFLIPSPFVLLLGFAVLFAGIVWGIRRRPRLSAPTDVGTEADSRAHG